MTSALTIAEVLALRGRLPIPAARREQVEGFFKNSYIVTRSITRRLAESAREIVWDFGVAPKDALHVASAIEAGVSELNTFDADLLKKSGQLGDPRLVIEKPNVPEPKLI